MFEELANAISHQTRRDILQILEEHEAVGMGMLAQSLGVAPATLTHHIDVLERAELVARVRCGRETLVEGRGVVEIVVYRGPFERDRETAHRLDAAHP